MKRKNGIDQELSSVRTVLNGSWMRLVPFTQYHNPDVAIFQAIW
jgi:hypothetical protein